MLSVRKWDDDPGKEHREICQRNLVPFFDKVTRTRSFFFLATGATVLAVAVTIDDRRPVR